MFQRSVFLLSFFFMFAVQGQGSSTGKWVPVTGDAAGEQVSNPSARDLQRHQRGRTVGLTHTHKKSNGASGPNTKACQQDKDCALVNPGCCPCSNGGESVAIHKDLVKSYNSKARGKCRASGQAPFCSTVYLCGKFQAKCENSKCVKVRCPAGQKKVCEEQAKKNDHNILTIDPGLFKPTR